MCMTPSDWDQCVTFHGHECPGLAIGYRVAKKGDALVPITRCHTH